VLVTGCGLKAPVYATPATIDVARIVLLDSGEIQEEDAAYLNRRARDGGENEEPVKPLYTRADVHDAFKLFKRVNYGQRTDLGGGVSFTFFDAGHILGSAFVVVDWTEAGQKRTLLFTADIGRYGSPILRDPHPAPRDVDVLITESTYGGKSHAPADEIEPQLLDAVKWAIDRKSRVIFPAFAVGRTQTILWYVAKMIRENRVPRLNIYVDSPMGVDVSKVHSEHRDLYDEQTRDLIGKQDLFGDQLVTFASSGQQSRQINDDRGPCVIVASSPTCEFGRVLHHLRHSVENPNDMVVFTGWIPPQTLGRRLQDGQQRLRILDRWYDRRCEVRTIHGLSAHADGEELMRFLQPSIAAGRTVAHVVHGEVEQAEAMAERLLAAGARAAVVPAMTTSSGH
jgi:metallo-beta-lactamase family protein